MAPKQSHKKPSASKKTIAKDNVEKAKGAQKKKEQTGNDMAGLTEEALKMHTALSASPSMDEKLNLLKASSIAANEKVKLLHLSMSTPEWNKLNGRFNTAKAKDEELQTQSDKNASRAEHRNLVAAFALDPSKGTIFQSLSHSLTSTTSIIKKEQAMSRKQVLEKWTEEELQLAIDSGRIIQKPDPMTPGLWEYFDTSDICTERRIDKSKEQKRAQEGEVDRDDEESMQEWQKMWNSSQSAFQNRAWWAAQGEEGKKDVLAIKGGTKGAGKGNPVAIMIHVLFCFDSTSCAHAVFVFLVCVSCVCMCGLKQALC